MIRLNQSLVDAIVTSLPEEVRAALMDSNGALCLAGGYIRDFMLGEEPKDIDIFGTCEGEVMHAVEQFDWDQHYTKKTQANSVAFSCWNGQKKTVQFVTRSYYADHDALIRSFDFTICQVCVFYDGLPIRSWIGFCTEGYLHDFVERALVYTQPERDEDPAGSLLRVVRFLKRGFTISEEELSKVLARMCAAIIPETELILRDKIQGQFRRVGYGGKTRIM